MHDATPLRTEPNTVSHTAVLTATVSTLNSWAPGQYLVILQVIQSPQKGHQDDQHEDRGKPHPRIQPGQCGEGDARTDAYRHRTTNATASPHERRHRNHDAIVTVLSIAVRPTAGSQHTRSKGAERI